MKLIVDPVLVEYANKYMDNFISNQTLTNEIMSFNLVPEHLKRGKTLDPYLRELLAEQDKYICLNQDKTLGNLQQRIAVLYGPLRKIWATLEAERESILLQMKGKLTPYSKCQNSLTKLFYFLDRL